MDPLDLFVAAMLAGLSFLLILQMAVAYRRAGNVRLLLLGTAFGLFFVEGLLLVVAQAGLISLPAIAMSRELMLLNLLIVLLFYAGTVKR